MILEVLEEVEFSNTFVNSSLTSDRPQNDLAEIISAGEDAGILRSECDQHFLCSERTGHCAFEHLTSQCGIIERQWSRISGPRLSVIRDES